MSTAVIDAPILSPRGSWNIVPIFEVCADGPWLARAPKTTPEDGAVCIYCGKSPIVCQECGRAVECAFCKRDSRYFLSYEPAEQDRYWVGTAGDDVLDLSRWDGSDVCFTNNIILTGRLADALIDAHADPLRLVPLRCYAPDPTILPRFQSHLSRRNWRHPSGIPNWQNTL